MTSKSETQKGRPLAVVETVRNKATGQVSTRARLYPDGTDDTAIGTVRPPKSRALPKVHRVKSWPESFRAVVTGRKRFEMRIDDRGYQPGDTIELREYTPNVDQLQLVPGAGTPGTFSGRSWMGIVGYVSRGGPLPAGWCAFDLISVEDVNRLEGVRR
jgi:hypothetical protein